jgi:hypothetical protein
MLKSSRPEFLVTSAAVQIAGISALPAFPDVQGGPEGPLTMAYEALTAKSSSSGL